MNTIGRRTTAAAALALATCLVWSLNGFAQDETPRLVITHHDGDYRGLVAGEENVLHMQVTNPGPRDVTGIRLSVTVPKGWTVVIEPDNLDLSARSSGTAMVRVTPPAGATDSHRHSITYRAESPEVRAAAVFDVGVRRSPRFWREIGAGLALVVVAGFILVYLRYGRG